MRCYERPRLLQLPVITATAAAACRMAKHKKEKKDKKDKKRRRRTPSSTDDSSSDEEEYKRRKAEKLVCVGRVAFNAASVRSLQPRNSGAEPGLRCCWRLCAHSVVQGRLVSGECVLQPAAFSTGWPRACVEPLLACPLPVLQAKKVAQHLKKHRVTGIDYTNEDNPFGDANLTERFVWGKKIEKEIVSGRDVRDMTAKAEARRQAERLVRGPCRPARWA